jgi:uncharacterized membrane protein
MLYALLKTLHLLGVIAWLGGMFFVLACLRPAAAQVLEPPERATLMRTTLRRFLSLVAWTALLVLITGAAMASVAGSVAHRSGLPFNVPLDWYAMAGLFVVMIAVFAHIRLVLFCALERAVAARAWADAARVMGAMRWEVLINLVIGVFIVLVVKLGKAA